MHLCGLVKSRIFVSGWSCFDGGSIVFVCAQCEAKRCPYGSAGTVFGVLDRGRGACLSTVEQTAAGLGKYNMALLLFWISFLYGRI